MGAALSEGGQRGRGGRRPAARLAWLDPEHWAGVPAAHHPSVALGFASVHSRSPERAASCSILGAGALQGGGCGPARGPRFRDGGPASVAPAGVPPGSSFWRVSIVTGRKACPFPEKTYFYRFASEKVSQNKTFISRFHLSSFVCSAPGPLTNYDTRATSSQGNRRQPPAHLPTTTPRK